MRINESHKLEMERNDERDWLMIYSGELLSEKIKAVSWNFF